MISDKIILS